MDSEDIMEPSTSDITDNQQVLFQKKSGRPKAKNWLRGKPKVMESHLALHCKKVSDYVSNMFLREIAERAERFIPNDSDDDNEPVSEERKKLIDCTLLIAFTCCGILWAIIDNSFFINLIKLLEPGYTPPHQQTLSGRLLDEELAIISIKINKFLLNQDYLTLSFDDCKEYLIAIQDYSLDSQIGTFIADKISIIIEKVGSSKFSAIVSDNGPNVKVARQITNETYPQIINIQCITHWFNLISSDLANISSIKATLINASLVINFFKKSYIASYLLRDRIKTMNIQGKNLELFVKTYWALAFNIADSII
ncbi:3956_t:CDS:2 [Scutellospora calospora]|uniref:3956_t:CDS:1 n=1 Tax=Scutellospora calospora TaxID=85575 RepID=A0ACA9N5W7_9GLOM|nr:3956_t:CDS:2 [Scutellospora calospora]